MIQKPNVISHFFYHQPRTISYGCVYCRHLSLSVLCFVIIKTVSTCAHGQRQPLTVSGSPGERGVQKVHPLYLQTSEPVSADHPWTAHRGGLETREVAFSGSLTQMQTGMRQPRLLTPGVTLYAVGKQALPAREGVSHPPGQQGKVSTG